MSAKKSPLPPTDIYMTPKRRMSESNRKILSQSLNGSQEVPEEMMRKYEKSQDKKYSLSDKFKNMEDPLRFIHSQKIERMMHETEEASVSFRENLNQIVELSKAAYKQVMVRETSEFNAQRFKDNFFEFQPARKEIAVTPRVKSKADKQNDENIKNQKYDSIHPKLKQMHDKYIKTPVRIPNKSPRHGREVRQRSESKVKAESLTWEHIRMIETPEFELKCRNVEFFTWLKSGPKHTPIHYNNDFNINESRQIDKMMNGFGLGLIEDSYEYGEGSNAMLYKFEENLRLHKHDNSAFDGSYGDRKVAEQQIMSTFNQLDLKKLSANSLYDIGMKKITPETIEQYKRLKKQHRNKAMYFDRADENLTQRYETLLQEFQMAKMVYKNSKQNKTKKYVHTWSNTISELKDKDLDTYFREDVHLIIEQIIRLDDLRQRVLKSRKKKPQLVLIKNICVEIKEVLFRLLMVTLRGQKFYQNGDVPFFTYADLIKVVGREDLERKILKVVYEKLGDLEVEEIDGATKVDIINIYVEERQKNEKILRILGN